MKEWYVITVEENGTYYTHMWRGIPKQESGICAISGPYIKKQARQHVERKNFFHVLYGRYMFSETF